MYTAEANRAKIRILPPCINTSEVDFLAGEGSIRYSLAALKNIGAQAVESIVAERRVNGEFRDLSDFARRCNTKALNKRALETLSAGRRFRRARGQPGARLRQCRAALGLCQSLGRERGTGHRRPIRRQHRRRGLYRYAARAGVDP